MKSYVKPVQESRVGVPVTSGDVSMGQVTASAAASKMPTVPTASVSSTPVPSTSGVMIPELLLPLHGSLSHGAVQPIIEPMPEEPDEPGDIEMDMGDDSGEPLEVWKEGVVYS